MRKSTKIWLIAAASLLLLGIFILGGTLSMIKWDLSKLSTVKYETNTHEITENFSNISINTNTSDLHFLPSSDGKCRVVCYEQKKIKHSVTVEGEALAINCVDTRKWYDYITLFSFGTPQITVYLPQNEYSSLSVSISTGDMKIPNNFKFKAVDINGSTGDVDCFASSAEIMKIKISTGDITIRDITAGSLDLTTSTGEITVDSVSCSGDIALRVSTGDTKLSDITAQSLRSAGNTGDMTLRNVIITEALNITRSTGDVKFDGCDAAEIFIKTDTGDVKGSLLSEKVFITSTDTGRVEHPKTSSGGRCEITTSTGNINIIIK